MKITQAQLSNQLNKTLGVFYWLSGDEALLLDESADLVRKACKQAGISERQVLHVDPKFNWQQLAEANQSMSLFGERKLIELRVSNKLNDQARKALQAYLHAPNPDNVLMLISPKIETASTKTKWFKQLESQGVWLPLWPIDTAQLPSWLQQRLQQAGYTIDADALALLAEKVDGNLLAGKQEVEKLSLLSQQSHIDAATVMSVVAESARYNVFDLSDAIMSLQLKRSIKVLNGLKAEGIEAPIILWALTRELRICATLKQAQNQGKNLQPLYKTHRIWNNKVQLVNTMLSHCTLSHFQQLIRFSAKIDQSIKGQINQDPWQLMQQLVFAWIDQTGAEFLAMSMQEMNT